MASTATGGRAAGIKPVGKLVSGAPGHSYGATG